MNLPKPATEMHKCPHCGGEYFTRVYAVWGTWPESGRFVGGDLKSEDGSTDNLIFGSEPKTITCDDCGKRSPNPHYFTL